MRRRSAAAAAAAAAASPSHAHHDVHQLRVRRAEKQDPSCGQRSNAKNKNNLVGITTGATTMTASASALMLLLLSLQMGTVQSQFVDNVADDSCRICQNGQSVPDGSLKPDEAGGSTCAELEAEAMDNPYYPCPIYHYFGALCGCPEQVPPRDACNLCQDGAGTITKPDLVADADTGQTCDSMALEAAFVSEETLGYSCSYYYMFGNKCGCTTNVPPEFSCGMLCDDGTPVPNPTAVAVDGRQCSVVEAETLYNPYELSCDPGQISYDGLLCGCDNGPPVTACGPLCGPGSVLPNPDQLVLNYVTCSELNDIATWDTQSDCEIYDLYAALCGCQAVPQPEESCGQLCQDGTAIPDPDRIVQDQPCREYEIMSIFETQLDNCPYYDMIGALCGCNNEAPVNGCGKLCDAGQDLPEPDLIVWGQTCNEWEAESVYDIHSGEFCEETYQEIKYMCKCSDVVLPDDGCGTLCLDGSDVPYPDRIVYNETCEYWNLESIFDAFGVEQGYCGDYSHIGELCGCSNEAPEDGCSLCDRPLAYPNRISYDLYGEVYTCQEDADYVPYAYAKEDKECISMQSVVGAYCGCESAPPKECSMCPEGGTIQMVNAPNFTYMDTFMGEQYISNENCVDVEYIVNVGSEGLVEEECAEISALVASECCMTDEKEAIVGDDSAPPASGGKNGDTTSGGGITTFSARTSGVVVVVAVITAVTCCIVL